MPTKVQELAGKITAKREQLAKYFEKKGPDGTIDVDATGRDAMKSLNTELDALVPQYEQLRADERAEAANAAALKSLNEVILPEGIHGGSIKTSDVTEASKAFPGLGDLFVGSKNYKSFVADRSRDLNPRPEFSAVAEGPQASIKTLFTRAAGFDPFSPRLPGEVLSPQQMPKIVDIIPQAETSSALIRWMLETTYTGAAAELAEAGTLAEAAYALTEQTSPVQKIGHFVPVTDEALADSPQMRDYLNGRLELGLKQRLDTQLLNGDGSTPNIRGLYNVASIGTQAQGSDPTPDAFYKAMVKVQTVGFADPSSHILHPTDWQNIRLLRTTEGLYIWGSPSEVGTARMWGLPVVTSTYNAAGTGLTGDFRMYTQLFYRQGVDFQVSNSHNDFFVKGQLAIKATIRVCLICTRPTALCKVTGIA